MPADDTHFPVTPLQVMWANLGYWVDKAYAEVPLDAKGRPDRKALRERAEARVMAEKVAKDLRRYSPKA